MAQIEIYQEVVIVDELGNRNAFGDRTRPVVFPAGGTNPGRFAEVHTSINAQSIRNVWSSSNSNDLLKFEIFMLRPDSDDLLVELVTDESGAIGTEVYTIGLRKDMWTILGRNDSFADYTIGNNPAGTLDAIDQVNVWNNHATDQGYVQVVLVNGG